MGFDCYCALCSGPLGIYSVKLGSAKLKHLAKRRKRVDNKRRRLKGEDVVSEDSMEWKEAEKREFGEEQGGGDEDMNEGSEGGDGRDNDGERGVEEMEDDAGEMEETMEGGSQEEGSHQGSGSEDEDGDENGDENDYDESVASDEDFSDKWSEVSELQQHSFNFRDSTEDETNSMFSFYEEHSYDPDKLTQEDVQWLDRCRALALNGEMEGRKKAFLSGRGRYDDYVSWTCVGHAFLES